MEHKNITKIIRSGRKSHLNRIGIQRFSGMVSMPEIPLKVKREYLTTRLLTRLTTRAFREASMEAMKVMGYVVIERDGWIVKKFEDGHIEKMHELEKSDTPLIFD